MKRINVGPTLFEAHRLEELEEAVGVLYQVSEQEGHCLAVFSWGTIVLPADMAAKLSSLVGQRVGILRLDGYRVRVLDRRHLVTTPIEDRLSWALSRIHELEEELKETRDIVQRLTEGDPVE
jgi:hypothetical protein